MKKRSICEVLAMLAFLLAAAWFFCPVGKPEGESVLFAMRLALPAVVLAVGSLWLRPRLMMAAFWFCALGDAMGVLGSFEGQMGGFALAHICFILYFIKGIRTGNVQPVVIAAISSACLIPLVVAAWKVIPAVHCLPIRIGCSVYALLLTGTVWTSSARALTVCDSRKTLPLLAALGGILFLVSDFVLAWNKFAEHISNASLCIMSTYYAALLLLFMGTCDFSSKKNLISFGWSKKSAYLCTRKRKTVP